MDNNHQNDNIAAKNKAGISRAIIAIIALAAVVGIGILGAWADKHYNTTAYIEMYAFLLVCASAIVFVCFRR